MIIEESRRKTMKSPALPHLRYVHIEENKEDVVRIQHALQMGGYEPQPLVVQTADELAVAIERPGWDLILTEWTLPTFHAKAALAQLADWAVGLPIIVVTGVAGEEVAVEALKAGAHDYVMKGRLARLIPAVEQALREDAERKVYKVMEEALRKSENRFRKLVEGAPLGIVFLDEQTRYVQVNQAFCEMVGYREEELIGQTYALVTHPDDLSQSMALAADMRDSQQPGFRLEKRYIRKDGQTIWVMIHPVNLALLGSRHPPVAAFIEDVTERKQSEARLRLSKFSIDRAGEAIFWGDPSARIIDVNEAACAMLGYEKDELCRLTVHDVTAQAKPGLWPGHWARLKQRETERFETMVGTKAGRIVPVDVVVNYLDVDGQEYSCAFVRDISTRKEMETALLRIHAQLIQAQKMEAIGRLAGGIAHDFNNLLTIINGQSELLLSDQVSTNLAKNSIEQIRDAGKRAAGLTRQLLIFTRQQVVQTQAMDINPIVKAMQMLLVRLIGEDIQIRLDLDDSVGPIMADVSQVEQILMNLVINARDAMPDGGTVTLKTGNVRLDAEFFEQQGMVPRPGHYCLLSVQDTGTGMDEQTARKVFEPFFTTKGLGKGTGLGLSTVKDIVQHSHGVVTFSTQLGQGSTFRVYFPHATSAVRQEVEVVSTMAADVRGTETILLIEDEPLVRQLLKVVLSSRGYMVLEAGTVKAACDSIVEYQGEIHLILSDVILPDGRGPHGVEQLRAMRPGIKVLFMSGYLGVESDQENIVIQQHPFIQKPFALPDLLETVRRVLSSA
jgi:two-component system, cell cycle sensor histidine kinase and response regulator CckA